ncbi:MAG: hypothetical protein NTZ05_09305 [Chloroflexi bacterium]|nr:hypothetical protein [Chloroflexota bacterium]
MIQDDAEEAAKVTALNEAAATAAARVEAAQAAAAAARVEAGKVQHAERIFLYEQLRKEILQNDTIITQILGATFAFVSALTGFAFAQKPESPEVRGIIFLFANFIALAGAYKSIHKESGTMFLSQYIVIFIENRLDLVKYETNLGIFRKRFTSGSFNKFTFNNIDVYTLLAIATSIASSYYFFQSLGSFYLFWDDAARFYMMIPVGVLVNSAFINWWIYRQFNRYVINCQATFGKAWQDIAEDPIADEPSIWWRRIWPKPPGGRGTAVPKGKSPPAAPKGDIPS